MTRIDHSRTNARDRMRRKGADSLAGHGLPGGLTPPRQRPSKAALREQLALATAKISRTIRCRCGHEGTAIVPAAKIGARLRCSVCGEASA